MMSEIGSTGKLTVQVKRARSIHNAESKRLINDSNETSINEKTVPAFFHPQTDSGKSPQF
jgi:hypothetical protein